MHNKLDTANRALAECEICESNAFQTIFPATADPSVGDASSFFLSGRTITARGRIEACSHCGFWRTNPQFAPTQYDQIYRGAKLHAASTGTSLANAKRYRSILRTAGIDARQTQQHLDFGCGDGGMLSVAGARRPLGVDIEVADGAWPGSSYMSGDLRHLVKTRQIESGVFDLVTAIDVLEHLPNFESYLQALADALSTDGKLVISVPDQTSLVARVTMSRWPMLLLEHLWYFAPDTIRQVSARCGLNLLESHPVWYFSPLSHIVRRVTRLESRFLNHSALTRFAIPVPVGITMFVLGKRGA